MSETTYLSVTQLAQRYAVDRSTVWRWTQQGKLPQPIKFSEGCTRWNLEDVEKAEREIREAAS